MLTVDIERKLGRVPLKTAFEAGEGVTALFGRSGRGQDSVVNAIARHSASGPGANRHQNGEPVFDSERGIDVPTPRRHIGYVFQEGRLFPHLNVLQNLRYAGLFSRGTSRSQLRTLSSSSIEGSPRSPAGKPLGGEKQRVAIGRALLSVRACFCSMSRSPRSTLTARAKCCNTSS